MINIKYFFPILIYFTLLFSNKTKGIKLIRFKSESKNSRVQLFLILLGNNILINWSS